MRRTWARHPRLGLAAKAALAHCAVRQADMYRLPLSGGYDVVLLQMVLHYAEDPDAALAEAARVLAPGGRLVVVDLAEHCRDDLTNRLAHRWPGFADEAMQAAFDRVGLRPSAPLSVPGPLEVRLWSGATPAPRVDAYGAEHAHEPVSEDA